jgi:hypothetical protein
MSSARQSVLILHHPGGYFEAEDVRGRRRAGSSQGELRAA